MLLNILILEVPSCIYIEYYYYRWDSSCLRSHRSLKVERSYNDEVEHIFDRLHPRGQKSFFLCLRAVIRQKTKVRWVILAKKLKKTFKWSDWNLSAIFCIRNVIFQKLFSINIIRSALKIHTLYFKCNNYLLRCILQ